MNHLFLIFEYIICKDLIKSDPDKFLIFEYYNINLSGFDQILTNLYHLFKYQK